MKTILLTLLLLMWSLGPLQAGTVLVLGDSLSAAYGIPIESGWVNLLQQRIEAEGHDYKVINASISGDTTKGGVTRLGRALQTHRPDILVIELGGNDGLRGVSLEETRNNLAGMIEQGLASDTRVLLLGMMIPPNFGKAFSERFHRIYHELAAHYGIPLVPFFLEGVAERMELMQRDGIHPRAEAQPRMVENVWVELQHLLRP